MSSPSMASPSVESLNVGSSQVWTHRRTGRRVAGRGLVKLVRVTLARPLATAGRTATARALTAAVDDVRRVVVLRRPVLDRCTAVCAEVLLFLTVDVAMAAKELLQLKIVVTRMTSEWMKPGDVFICGQNAGTSQSGGYYCGHSGGAAGTFILYYRHVSSQFLFSFYLDVFTA